MSVCRGPVLPGSKHGVCSEWVCKRRQAKPSEATATASQSSSPDNETVSDGLDKDGADDDADTVAETNGDHSSADAAPAESKAEDDAVDASSNGDDREDSSTTDRSVAEKPDPVKTTSATKSARTETRKPFNSQVWNMKTDWAGILDRSAKTFLEISPEKETSFLAKCDSLSTEQKLIRSDSMISLKCTACRFETRAAESIDQFIAEKTQKESDKAYRCLLPPHKRFKVRHLSSKSDAQSVSTHDRQCRGRSMSINISESVMDQLLKMSRPRQVPSQNLH
eukprot:SAG31_NODE_921_length_10984_cov_2.779329_2_plen_280_part_00